ncbi:unnamed protein product [Fusarium fujikuroi]|nr:hypothetical protein CEK25_012997 [Fusarium fujikuroi]VZI13731.1 unnamed protein product [Fusarium fujikuroi]
MFSKLFLLALPLVLAAPAVKRTEGDITFYTPGQGACAGTHGVEDMVAAACKDTDLDVSPAAFEQAIGPKNIGRGKGTWNFV